MALQWTFSLADQILLPAQNSEELLIFFHGLGATKEDLVPLFQEIQKQQKKQDKISMPLSAFFVQAPIQPCHLFGNQPLPCWFDVQSLEDIVENNWRGLSEIISSLLKLIHQLKKSYPQFKKISLIGFSQGGVVAQKLAEQLKVDKLALLSTFAAQPLEPVDTRDVFIAHGLLDPVVGIIYGRDLHAKAKEKFTKSEVSYHEYSYMDHGICQEEIEDLTAFLFKKEYS